ncbi:MAG TPA: hypothetical protein VJI15_00110 [Candidatus Nanoarchaeia archaeon]|nr:hypothetical protein [Candidatus Nanoarchaeia archaeon]
MTARGSSDNLDTIDYSPLPEDDDAIAQQQKALEDLEMILEHTVVARPTRYKVVSNGQMLQMANFMLAEVYRTKGISRKVRDVLVDFQSLLAYIAQDGKEKYRECVQLGQAMDNTYRYLMNCSQLELPETSARQRLVQEFNRGKQVYDALEEQLRAYTVRGNIVTAFYDRLRDAIRGEYEPLDLDKISQSSRQITDKFWPLEGKF